VVKELYVDVAEVDVEELRVYVVKELQVDVADKLRDVADEC
jgi:hypothetical protein